ncbi:TraB/GumN family protein [Aquiflexum lacus]|uniref:TraB/GumN family protein n=1 Tax=Aquiflexum lacus TaxID=2483805 RepID=UPI001895A62D|nr:TraB/GumN family protein [Aquiflexum lacus]
MKTVHSKSLIASILLVFLFFNVIANEGDEKSLLWKISGKGLEKESYLFGTIHIICQDQFFMDERIENALESTRKIALELNMTDPNIMAEMQQLSVNKDFKNIKGDLTTEQAAAMDEFLTKSYGVGLDQLGILKPFVLSSMVMLKMLPCEQQSSYEMFFVEKAKDRQIEMVGLETVAFQVGIFDEIPQRIQIEDLAKLVTEDDGMEEFESLVAAYLEEDIEGLYRLITDNDMFKEYGDLLLADRNANWIPVIEELIHQQSTFIAVGSGHLASETGVIALLRKAGYTVEAVK